MNAMCCNDKSMLILLKRDDDAIKQVYNRSLLFPGKFDSFWGL